jgi:ATP-dependent helicase HrpB
LGRRIASLPTHPRLGRLLIEAKRRGCLERAALAAALLSERSPFARSDRGDGPRATGPAGTRENRGRPPRGRSGHPNAKADFHSQSDLLDQIAALEAFEARGTLDSPCGPINRSAARLLFRVRDQLVRRTGGRGSARSASDPGDEGLLRALLSAFPDRLARRRSAGSPRGVMVGGRGVRLAEQSRVLEGELFLCLDVDNVGTEALVRSAASIDRAWLPPPHLREHINVAFDSAAERVSARRRVLWDDLVLEDTAAPVPDGAITCRILADAARDNWDRVFPQGDSAVANFVARVRWLRGQLPELDLPTVDDEALQSLLPALCAGKRSFDQLRKAGWMGEIKSLFRFDQLQLVEREAPPGITVPSGRTVALQYEANKPPILAVRIQEVFGLAQTPRIARGRVRVLLHLLAPNMRAQQVTDDLLSFWQNVYPQVRKELRGRYPKHAWPEDPLQARAERM